jgi:3'-phosphoadenosine 5'-phosphosulfate sulfotransferase (PAPS reductase)/FAD synthetase
MEERLVQLEGTGKPFWPSSAQRYCTSDLKRDPINTWLRQFPHVVSAVGIRAQESTHRRQAPLWMPNTRLSTRTRKALVWHPIHSFRLPDVWEACGVSQEELDERRGLFRMGLVAAALKGWRVHPAYVFGNERLSCVLCVMGSQNDLRVGGRHNPGLLREYLEMEERSGCAFKKGCSLSSLFSGRELAPAYTETAGVQDCPAFTIREQAPEVNSQLGLF